MNALHSVVNGTVPPGIYRLLTRATTASICKFLEHADFRCFVLAGQIISDKASFLRACSEAMGFPAYFGHNWDALDECITDLSWVPGRGYVVLYNAVAHFATSDRAQWTIALDLLQTAVAHWQTTPTPMYVLLRDTRGTTPDIPVLPVNSDL